MSTEMRDVSRKEVLWSDRRKNTTLSIPLFMVDFPITFYIREVFGRLSPGAQRLGGGLTSGNETITALAQDSFNLKRFG